MLCTVVKTFLMLIKPTDSEQSLQPRGPYIQNVQAVDQKYQMLIQVMMVNHNCMFDSMLWCTQ